MYERVEATLQCAYAFKKACKKQVALHDGRHEVALAAELLGQPLALDQPGS